MKKLFATALMAMSMGSVFAQGNIVANDTVKTDTTKNCPAKDCFGFRRYEAFLFRTTADKTGEIVS